MGIPRLVGHLEPYASTIRFTRDEAIEPRPVVIDGPGLAFYAVRLALQSSSGIRVPSYLEIGDAALQWLRSLQFSGLKIHAIYFDGFLPEYKEVERHNRLTCNVGELLHPRVSPKVEKLAVRAPFIAPSVMEVLLASEFSSITFVIPGEADPWCAEHAREVGSIIITGDSDLLVHNVGRGSVMFFNSINIEDSSVKALIYAPAEIADRLGLVSLRSLAYALPRDRHTTMNQLIKTAKHLEESMKFINLDDHGIPCPTVNSPIDKNTSLFAQNTATASRNEQQDALQRVLNILDPRISEFVQQVLSCQFDQTLLHKLKMYLPVLIDDVDRSTAWNCGEHIRQIGYSITTATLTTKPRVIYEVGRSGKRIVEKEQQLSCYPMSIATFIEGIREWPGLCKGLSPVCLWRLFGVYSMWQNLNVGDKACLSSRKSVIQLILADTTGTSWSFIHLDAQLQALLYSLRMLQRFTKVYLAYPVEEREEEFTKIITNLHDSLTSLPPLAELIPQNYSPSAEEREAIDAAIVQMYALHSVQEVAPNSSKKKGKGAAPSEKKQKKARKASKQSSSNIYAVLKDD